MLIQAKGIANLEELKITEEVTCEYCGDLASADVDVFKDGLWFHKHCMTKRGQYR